VRVLADRHERAARFENAARLVKEAHAICEVMQRVDTEHPVERRVAPRQRFRPRAHEPRVGVRGLRSRQHAGSRLDAGEKQSLGDGY
jgi:hypothetical protein